MVAHVSRLAVAVDVVGGGGLRDVVRGADQRHFRAKCTHYDDVIISVKCKR